MEKIDHASMLSRREIVAWLDEYDGHKYDSSDSELPEDERLFAGNEVDEVDPQLVEQLRAMVEETDADTFIHTEHFDNYARELFDECYGTELQGFLRDKGIERFVTVNYHDWANALADDYSEFEYDGTDYLAQY